MVTPQRWIIMLSGGHLGNLVSGVVLVPRLGEDVVYVSVEVEGSLHVGDGGELAELLGQDAGAVE